MKIPSVARAVGYFREDLVEEALEEKLHKKEIPWRRWVAVAACLAVVLALVVVRNLRTNKENGVAVHQAENYTIMESDGMYFLRMEKDVQDWVDNQQGTAMPPPGMKVTCSSLQEMKKAILKGSFTNAQMLRIKNFEKDSNGNIAVCDLDALWEAVVPEGLRVTSVIWRGVNYDFWIGIQGEDGEISVLSENSYRKEKERYAFRENDNLKIISVIHDPERNAAVTEYENQNLGTTGRYVLYSYEKDGFLVTVQERCYNLKDGEIYINLYGEGNGVYYHAFLGSFLERPSMDWIQSWGIQPYIEPQTE